MRRCVAVGWVARFGLPTSADTQPSALGGSGIWHAGLVVDTGPKIFFMEKVQRSGRQLGARQ